MSTQELVLNIAVNLGRIARFASEGRLNRVEQFLNETKEYIRELDSNVINSHFQQTFDDFKKTFNELEKNKRLDTSWSETAYTWANILTHRAKLAA